MPDGHDAQRSPRRSAGGERKRAPSGVRNGSRDDASAKAQKSYERYIALAHDAAAAETLSRWKIATSTQDISCR